MNDEQFKLIDELLLEHVGACVRNGQRAARRRLLEARKALHDLRRDATQLQGALDTAAQNYDEISKTLEEQRDEALSRNEELEAELKLARHTAQALARPEPYQVAYRESMRHRDREMRERGVLERRVAELETGERKMNSALQSIADCAEDFGAPVCAVPNLVIAENMRKKMVNIYGRLMDMYGDDAEHLGQPYGDGFDAILAGLHGATVVPNEDESKDDNE